MDTKVSCWQIVTIKDGENVIGKVLWGNCLEDHTLRFAEGDYICTSKLVEINPKKNLLKTASGSIYKVVGDGKKADIDYCDFELLRNGFSPQQIKELKSLSFLH